MLKCLPSRSPQSRVGHTPVNKSFERGKQRITWPLGDTKLEAQFSQERGWFRLGISELMKSKLRFGGILRGSQVLAERSYGDCVSMCPEVCMSETWKGKCKWLLKTGVLGQKGDSIFEELGRETELRAHQKVSCL